MKNNKSFIIFIITTIFLVGCGDNSISSNTQSSQDSNKLKLEDKNINSYTKVTISKSYWDNTKDKSKTESSYPEIIDGNRDNMVYVKAFNKKNWIQLEFPEIVNISRLKIYVNDHKSSIKGVSVYALNKPYTTSVVLNDTDKIASLEAKTLNDIKMSISKNFKYILLKKDNNRKFGVSEIDTFGKFVKPFFIKHEESITLESDVSVGDIVADFNAISSQGESLTYTINPSDTPFIIDSYGKLKIDGVVEEKDYNLTIEVNDGLKTATTNIILHLVDDTKSLSDAKNIFIKKAESFKKDSDLNKLVNSYLVYAGKKERILYSKVMQSNLPEEFWSKIESDYYLKEGLYASRFPADPHSVKNLYNFFTKWKEDGKSDEFIDKYKNVALGFAINAKERGIFDNPIGGDTSEHKIIDYTKLSNFEAETRAWKSSFKFTEIENIENFKDYLYLKYRLTKAERDAISSKINRVFRKMQNNGIDIVNASPAQRAEYHLSYTGQNMLRVINGLDRLNCFESGNICQKIQLYVDNNSSLIINKVLGYFKDYKGKIGFPNEPNTLANDLRGKFNIVPNENNSYKLIPFYDLANWKISLNEIPAIDFEDNEPNWPIFDFNLTNLPWQIMALEQDAQMQECQYVKSRFFETDKNILASTYPPNSVDDGKKERRFIEYTKYTSEYDKPEVKFRNSSWSPKRTIYRILQDGGVCGRQSSMGQHVNECLNRPSIGIGQPGHRAWLGVYLSSDIPNQLITKIGYDVFGREFSYSHISTIYNQYTKEIRPDGIEKFTGIVTGTSKASSGEHGYNQSMILQHIAKILENEGGKSPVVLLKKALEIAPTNSDAWYQLALYYASKNDLKSIDKLAREYQQKRENFFMDSGKSLANNLEAVTARNIELTIMQTSSVDWGKGSRAEEAKDLVWNYLNDFENIKRSTSSYNAQNRFLHGYYIVKQNNKDGFNQSIKELFTKFVTDEYSGYEGIYFKDIHFTDINKTALIDELVDILEASKLSENKKNTIYTKIFNRSRETMLAEVILNDICIDNNIINCTSKESFILDKSRIYMTLDDADIGKFGELDVSEQGKEGSTVLPIPVVDNNDVAIDIRVHIAKLTVDGRLLKINDPTYINNDKTEIITWIDFDDNQMEESKSYNAVKKLVLKVKYRDTNNEYSMGSISIDINNLLEGHSEVFNTLKYKSEKYHDDSTSIYFVTHNSSIGATKGVWAKSGKSTLRVKVVDDNKTEYEIKLMATNNNRWTMPSGLNPKWDNTLKINYNQDDNPDIPLGTHLKSLNPIIIDALMWHKNNEIRDRIYLSVDFTTP